MGVTLQQIADMAGVHKSTVDKVIHNRPGVSDAKRQMIRQLLEENNYEANPLGKALNYQKKKMKVIVILPEVDATSVLKRGMEFVRQDFNSFNIEIRYDIINFLNKEEKMKELESLSKEEITGAILMPMELEVFEEIQHMLQKNKIPVITINTDLIDETMDTQLCCVSQDYTQEGKVAGRMMQLLLPEGGKLGIISRKHLRSVRQRETAFLSYIEENVQNIQPEEPVYIQENSTDAYKKTAAFLEKHPDVKALFLTCGRVVDICQAVKDAGREKDLTIVCYERYPEIFALIRQGVVDCTISSDLTDQGRLALRLLFEYLIYDKKPEKERIHLRSNIFLKENV